MKVQKRKVIAKQTFIFREDAESFLLEHQNQNRKTKFELGYNEFTVTVYAG